jgi:hypothetical protein
MVKILKPFRELKRIISQWVETEYWYRFRKILHYYFNDETQKYELSKYDNTARDITTCTWNGDSDILQMALLKTEHMFYNLKKHSYHQYFYVDAYRFFEEGATDSDRSIFARQVLDNCEKNPEQYKYYSNFHRKEFYSDRELRETVTKKDHKHKKYVGFENSWWIGNEEVDKSISDSGLIHYYLYHNDIFDGWGWTTTWGIKRTYDEQIPPSEIPKEKKQYYLNLDEPGLGHEEAPQYRTKTKENVTCFPSCYTWTDIQKIIDDKGIKINVLESFLIGTQTMLVDDMKVYAKLSPYIKSKARGLRRVLVELLHFRHMLKKLINMSDADDKYFSMWNNVKDPKKKRKKLEESIDLYRKDRKNLYHEIAEFMAENGDSWWD